MFITYIVHGVYISLTKADEKFIAQLENWTVRKSRSGFLQKIFFVSSLVSSILSLYQRKPRYQ